ncbi:MAG: hypothetical protein FWF52_03870 [Candidatus Azobacteroides sp.]|nr:hypothetical protein [Candidatus Azobacteroides sp.]
MNKWVILALTIVIIVSCGNSNSSKNFSSDRTANEKLSESQTEEYSEDEDEDEDENDEDEEEDDDEVTATINVETTSKNPNDLVRSDEIIFDRFFGDLNKDGEDDCVIITKQTKKSAFVTDENRGKLDRNRRGILIAFKEGEYYNTFLAIPDCFSSENEDGGVYFPPELSFEINRGNLTIHYGHGRYGWWQYVFRYQNNNFELIGYDQADMYGPVLRESVSINFLTKKKQTRTNTNPNDHDSNEIIKETWQRIDLVNGLVRLTDIEDFDNFNVSSCYSIAQ